MSTAGVHALSVEKGVEYSGDERKRKEKEGVAELRNHGVYAGNKPSQSHHIQRSVEWTKTLQGTDTRLEGKP